MLCYKYSGDIAVKTFLTFWKQIIKVCSFSLMIKLRPKRRYFLALTFHDSETEPKK